MNTDLILKIARGQMNSLEKAADTTHPVEACALLFGKLRPKDATVERIVVTANVLQSTSRFQIDTKAFYDAFMEAERDRLDFLGFFHSHPASAVPSSVDLHFMRLWGDVVWLIFSSTEDRFAAFQMKKGKAHRLELKIERKIKE